MSVPPHEGWIERQIREATERGEFDNLPGAGRPLRHESSRDPDWWVKGMLEREGLDAADAMPPALQLRREAAGFPESLVGESAEENVRELLRDYNRRVLEERRRPTFGRHSPPIAPTVEVEEVISRWREMRAARAVEAPPAPSPPPARCLPWWRRLRRS